MDRGPEKTTVLPSRVSTGDSEISLFALESLEHLVGVGVALAARPDSLFDDGLEVVVAVELFDHGRGHGLGCVAADQHGQELAHLEYVVGRQPLPVGMLEEPSRHELWIERVHGDELARYSMPGDAEIAQLEHAPAAYEDVGRGDVAMGGAAHVELIEELEQGDDLALGSRRRPRLAGAREVVVDGPAIGQFENQAVHDRAAPGQPGDQGKGVVELDDPAAVAEDLAEVRFPMPAGLVGGRLETDFLGGTGAPVELVGAVHPAEPTFAQDLVDLVARARYRARDDAIRLQTAESG